MINYIRGDLFSHSTTKVSILAHANNCRGSWGAGVATIFRKKFPSTYKEYVAYCKQQPEPASLLGSTYLIPAQQSDPAYGNGTYVACLFTSDFAGRKKLAPDDIVKHTATAMTDLEKQTHQLAANGVPLETHDGHYVVNMPKINAGLFGVPWEQTAEVLEASTLHINVYVIDT